MDKEISVIIPTRDREAILKQCLLGLLEQSIDKERLELIVVDDGSTDRTEQLVSGLDGRSGLKIEYLRQARKGPAAARNLGLKNARGRIVLLLGDDIIADRRLLEEHLMSHRHSPKEGVVLGLITWHQSIKLTPFAEFLQEGVQSDYGKINAGMRLDFDHFISSNVSVDRDFLLRSGGFDEDFKCAAFEDTELGYRLEKMGMSLKFNPRAVGYHLHKSSLFSYSRRQFVAGRSAVILMKKHPELRRKIMPRGILFSFPLTALKLIVAIPLMFAAAMLGSRSLLKRCYGVVLTFVKILGVIWG